MRIKDLQDYITAHPQCEELWINTVPPGDFDFHTVASIDNDCFEVGGPWVITLQVGPPAEEDEE